ESPEIRQRVISSLGLLATEKALGILKTVLLNANSADFERMQALQSLASSRAGTTWLLAAQDRNELPEDLLAETGRLLRSSPHQDLRNKAHLVFPVKAKMDIRKLPSSHELAKQIGSADRGKLLVMNHKDLACTKCHSVQGEGGRIGPDLSMIGIKGSKENLFDSILLPDKAIADQFIQYTLETRQGVVLTGLIVEETAEHIILRDANGKDTRIAQQDLAQRSKSSKSLMPDNLASFLTEDELIDVVSYLTTLKTPTLSIEYWRVLGPFSSNAPADVELKYKPGSDKLVDLHAKYTNKQGTLQWRTVPVNAQNQLDLLTLQGDSAAQGTTYLYAELEAGQTGSGKIQLATTEAIQVYWNGKQVLQQGLGPPTEGKFHSVPVEMPRGVNTLLIQVRSGTRPEPISCTILAPGQETLRLLR
ncbi:MAG TPA: c-type cytochrome, partial [Gemmatales bacterium]|nr:c-type cytochrome [Gemmatales bacterium]